MLKPTSIRTDSYGEPAYNSPVRMDPIPAVETRMPNLERSSLIQNRETNLVKLLEAADSAANRSYLMTCANHAIVPCGDKQLSSGNTKGLEQMSLFKLTRLVYDAEENPAEKLKSFFLAFSGLANSPSVFFVLQNEIVYKNENDSKSKCVKKGQKSNERDNEYAFSLYLGVKPQGFDHSEDDADTVRKIFKDSFDGTFLGSAMEAQDIDKIKSIQITAGDCPNVVCVTAQPSVKKDTDENTIEQGLEHFIDVMRGHPYTAVLLATPVSRMIIERRKREIENLYSKLSLFQKVSVAFGENVSEAIGKSVTQSTSVSETDGTSLTQTNSESRTTGRGGGSSSSTAWGEGSSSSTSSSWNESETIGFSTSAGTSHTIGTTDGKSIGGSETTTKGSSITHTIEAQNKSIVDLLARLDETLQKMANAETFGLWECAAYFMSPTFSKAAFAANTFKSLVLGDESAGERCHTIHWPRSSTPSGKVRQRELCHYIMCGEHPVLENRFDVFRRVMPTNFVSGKDLPYFLRLPQKSVPGLAVDTIASFERSVVTKASAIVDENKIDISFGHVCHMDREELPISLNLNDFTKHCFITGSTGSGKSNTTELLLQRCIESNVNFLVVEPAKGEYKKSFKNADGINIFTTHPLCESLLHINPFRFENGIHVLEHIDRLLGIFSSCWELTAAMPAILKKSVEQAYQVVGWDLANSYYIGSTRDPKYPTFSTLTTELKNVIDNSSYSAEAKGNYTGALVTRVESLTAGVLRQVFCNEFDIDSSVLFDGKTIVDLSRLGSAETKTLIMGVLVMQLSEYRQATAKGTNLPVQHITVIEEAHNLLRNSVESGGGSDLIRKSVEMISNAIAEMRTYGEGFMIVDQSPTAVDISAIKNTNTKIVMRLPEQHDCEAVANAMGLNEFQTKEIAKLPPGVAVVMQNSWASAILTKIFESTPPKGKEEWTDSEFNRELRARIAVACGDVGYKRAKYFLPGDTTVSKEEFEALPTMADLESKIDEAVAKDYDKFVGMDRMNDLASQHKKRNDYPMPARARELHAIFKYYSEKYGLGQSKSPVDNFVNFGLLSIALLGCWEVWRMFNNLPDEKRIRVEFRRLISEYIPRSIAVSESKKIGTFEVCIRKAFEAPKGAIILSGGTKKDQMKFVDSVRVQVLAAKR